MNIDQQGAINEFLKKLIPFYKERDWEKFHSPKNIVMDIASEVGELIEPFRWLTEEQSANLDPKTLQEVRDEIADVFIVLVYLAHLLEIDPLEAAHAKLEKIGQKYPAHLCRGKSDKYTSYQT